MARGIAAVVDAIFLLIIAAIASGIVLAAASSYGRNFDLQAHKLLINYYAKQVVRTIVTASTWRDDRNTVPDYLLAFIKENVENFKDLGKAEDRLIEVVGKAMKPIENSYDYAVLIDGSGTSWDTVYMIYKITYNGMESKGSCVFRNSFDGLTEWISNLGESYTSATTIYMRYCTGSCAYIPVDIRVIVFPRGSTAVPICS